MPAITPGYLYTFFALIAVSSILLAAFIDYTNAIRFSSETRMLKDLMDYVAAEATELLTMALTTNVSAETYIQAPAALGHQQYWLAFKTNSAKAWLEGGFGKTLSENGWLRVYLPCNADVSGYYVSGYGAICLTCSTGVDSPRITISGLSQKGA